MTVVIAHVTLVLPFATLIISARLRSLDIAVEDAARDLGAKESEIFGLVLIPQIKTSLVNAFLLSFLMSFDDFLVSYFTNGAGQDTLPVLLYSQMKFGLSPVLTALSVLILLVSALICSLMLLLQKKDFK
jgi:spermidine/putrescine transport system permease protein